MMNQLICGKPFPQPFRKMTSQPFSQLICRSPNLSQLTSASAMPDSGDETVTWPGGNVAEGRLGMAVDNGRVDVVVDKQWLTIVKVD